MMRMKAQEFILSCKGLARTAGIQSEDFTFVVGSREFKCNVFQAAFISKAVARQLVSDSTTNKFEVSLSEEEEYVEGFKNVVRLMEGCSISINSDNCGILERLGKMIDNEELIRKVVDYGIGKESLSVSNCIENIRLKEEFGCEVEEELKFIAEHFYEVNQDEVKTLRNSTVEAIVSHENLCLEDEESLLEFISSLGEEELNLYGYVECRYLSLEGIEKFVEGMNEEMIDGRIWRSICGRLRCELSNRTHVRPRFHQGSPTQSEIESYEYVAGHEVEGIINALTKKCGGNVHEKRIINITWSSSGRGNGSEVVNQGSSDYWVSTNEPNSWICFDFKEKRISLTQYSWKPYASASKGWNSVQWEVEGSNDGGTWTTLDKRNTQELNSGNSEVKIFGCAYQNRSNFFRFIRFRQTGKRANGDDILVLVSVELFGDMK
jgi:hypothetical protein